MIYPPWIGKIINNIVNFTRNIQVNANGIYFSDPTVTAVLQAVNADNKMYLVVTSAHSLSLGTNNIWDQLVIDISGNAVAKGTIDCTGLKVSGVAITVSPAQLNALYAALGGVTASDAEINTACDGATAKNSHTHTLADGGTDVTASAAEVNTTCDGATAKNSHTHTLADGGTDVTASAAEVNTACDGIGVSIPKRKIVSIGDWNMDSTGTITVAHDLTVTKIRGITGVIRNDGDTTYYPIGNIESSGSGAYPDSWFRYIDGTNVSIARQTAGFFDSVTFDSTSYNRGYLIIDYID